jgi:hypothetical protein
MLEIYSRTAASYLPDTLLTMNALGAWSSDNYF